MLLALVWGCVGGVTGLVGLWKEDSEEEEEAESVGVCISFRGEDVDLAGVGVSFRVEAESWCGGQELLRGGHGLLASNSAGGVNGSWWY